MKRKYVKLNDGYSHLSLGNVINVIKEESKNKSSAIQGEIFCAIFSVDYVNNSTVNNYCIGSRGIGDNYKQIYINLRKKFDKDKTVFKEIICNILTIVEGVIYSENDINVINQNGELKNICCKLYNIGKNDTNVNSDHICLFRELYKNENYYELFANLIMFAILEKKQPLYVDEKIKNVVEIILENTDISVNDLQNFLILEMNDGSNFDFSLVNLANQDNPYANYELGKKEYRGEFEGKPNYGKAFYYFEKAALKNHPSAYWMMGNMVKNGLIGNYEYDKAFEYFEKAKILGSVAAINSLGIMYQNGYGVKQDEDMALRLFKEAASKNYAYAFNNLANYYKGKDNEKVFEYFYKSASLGESYGCKELGIIYLNRKDYKNAFVYFNKALDASIKERNIWAYYYLAKHFYLTGSLENKIVKNADKAIQYFNYSSILIDSLCELLYIYYERHELEKVYYYKSLIENHELYNDEYKKIIEDVLDKIKTKKSLDITF